MNARMKVTKMIMDNYIVRFDRGEAAAPFLIDIPFLYSDTYITAIISYMAENCNVQLAVKVINSIVLIIIIKYFVCLPQAVCGWLIINASVEAYRACQVYESSVSPQQSQSDSHSALNTKC